MQLPLPLLGAQGEGYGNSDLPWDTLPFASILSTGALRPCPQGR